ncbi:MAG: hypothetical protein EBU08_13360 [Micrococcales bacterium]|nr:hypothetical protein [Micrococcales bacterium]
MTQKFDGNYDYTKPWRAPVQPDQVAKRWQYNGPWSTNMERLTSQALMVMNIPGKDIQAMVRPPLPQIRLFPERYGYGDRRSPGIEDVVTIDRVYSEPRISWFSGGPGGFSATARNDLGGI